MNPVPMEFEVVIDHFYVFDNVGVFPVKTAIDFFPNFIQKIYNTGYDLTNNHRIVFAAVSSENESYLIKTRILDIITRKYTC